MERVPYAHIPIRKEPIASLRFQKVLILCAASWLDTAKRLPGPLSSVRQDSSGHDSSVPAPEFFDEPQFTVAGVTDPTNLGGHGSDTTVRTRESLAKATATLGRSPDASHPNAAAIPTEESLRQAVQHEPGDFRANYQ